jgi:hypothetical protein
VANNSTYNQSEKRAASVKRAAMSGGE